MTLRNQMPTSIDWWVANGGSPSLSVDPTSGTLAAEEETVSITATCRAAGRTETSIVFAAQVPGNPDWLTQALPLTLECKDDGGDTWGDPHLVTYDGVKYDFQAKGEFVLSRGSVGDFEVQTRQQPRGNSAVTLNKAVAFRVGTDRIGPR